MIRLLFSFIFFLTVSVLAEEKEIIGAFSNGAKDNWTFYNGKEFPPGAQGNFAVIEDSSLPGGFAAYLEGAFGAGGGYVSMNKKLPSPLPFKCLEFDIKTKDYEAVTIRLIDSTGQVHQQVIALKKDNQYQHIKIESYNGKPYINWGGANDKQWHDPLKELSILASLRYLDEGVNTGTVMISNISLVK